MKTTKLLIFLLSFFMISCGNSKEEPNETLSNNAKIVIPDLQSILDSLNLEGAILVYDKQKESYYSNDFQESQINYLPASTFKIPNSIIGLELGILENENTIFKWDSTDRYLPVWEQDLTLRDAFQTSCVPCYQELARKIGVVNMKHYLLKLDFGDMHVSEESIDNFWLIGTSKISPFEQIDFLERLYDGRLAVSDSTSETIRKILEISSNEVYSLSGKTGLAVNGEKDVGWFVGYVKKENAVYYFATKISPKADAMDRSLFNPLRQQVSMRALAKLGIIQ